MISIQRRRARLHLACVGTVARPGQLERESSMHLSGESLLAEINDARLALYGEMEGYI